MVLNRLIISILPHIYVFIVHWLLLITDFVCAYGCVAKVIAIKMHASCIVVNSGSSGWWQWWYTYPPLAPDTKTHIILLDYSHELQL